MRTSSRHARTCQHNDLFLDSENPDDDYTNYHLAPEGQYGVCGWGGDFGCGPKATHAPVPADVCTGLMHACEGVMKSSSPVSCRPAEKAITYFPVPPSAQVRPTASLRSTP